MEPDTCEPQKTQSLLYLLVPKGEWGSEYRYHSRGIYGGYISMIIGIHSPTLLKHPVSICIYVYSNAKTAVLVFKLP